MRETLASKRGAISRPEGRSARAANFLTATIDEQGADVLSERRFRYLVLGRDLEGGWKGEIRDPTASGAAGVVANSNLRQRPAGSLCRRP